MIRIAGYVALFVTVFLVTVYLRFPYAEVVRQELATMELPADLAIDFASLGPYGLGVSGTDLRIDRRGAGNGVPVFAAADFRLGGLLRSVAGPVHLDGRFRAYGGDLQAAIDARDGGGYDVHMDGKELSLTALVTPFSDRFRGVRGEIGGALAFSGDLARWPEGDGKLEVDGGPGAIAGVMFFGQAVPEVGFDRIVARLQMDKGVLQIEEAALSGTDLSATVDGRIRVRMPLAQSVLDLNCKISLPPAVIASLEGLVDLASAYRQDDGSYQFQVRGTFLRPRLR